jgi:hypothetical protein
MYKIFVMEYMYYITFYIIYYVQCIIHVIYKTDSELMLTAYTTYEVGKNVPKRRHIKFRPRGTTQNKECNIQNRAKV